MIVNQACVLLSGGMDSCAALCWAHAKYPDLLAVMFDYGQPNRDQELTAAGRLCTELGVKRELLATADAIPRKKGILSRVVDHDGREDGTSPAVVTGRNTLLASSAAAHAADHFTNGNIALVLGCNAQDAKRFPDCHPAFLRSLAETLCVGIAREIQVVAPWIDRTKTQILQSLSPEDRARVARSWSCYRKTGPCGTCSACVLRAEAFAAVGVADECAMARMTGGDPSRESAFGPPIPIYPGADDRAGG